MTFVVPGKYVVFRLFVALLTAYKCVSLSPVDPKSRVALVADRAVKGAERPKSGVSSSELKLQNEDPHLDKQAFVTSQDMYITFGGLVFLGNLSLSWHTGQDTVLWLPSSRPHCWPTYVGQQWGQVPVRTMTLFKFVTFVVPSKYVMFRLFVVLLSAFKCISLSSVDPKTQHSSLRHAHGRPAHSRNWGALAAQSWGLSLHLAVFTMRTLVQFCSTSAGAPSHKCQQAHSFSHWPEFELAVLAGPMLKSCWARWIQAEVWWNSATRRSRLKRVSLSFGRRGHRQLSPDRVIYTDASLTVGTVASTSLGATLVANPVVSWFARRGRVDECGRAGRRDHPLVFCQQSEECSALIMLRSTQVSATTVKSGPCCLRPHRVMSNLALLSRRSCQEALVGSWFQYESWDNPRRQPSRFLVRQKKAGGRVRRSWTKRPSSGV